MNTEFREEWRRWHEAQITEISGQVHRMARRVDQASENFRIGFFRSPDEAALETRRHYRYARYEELWPKHQFGLSHEDCVKLADIKEFDLAYSTLCRKIAEDWLWSQMQAEVCTDKIEMPENLLETL